MEKFFYGEHRKLSITIYFIILALWLSFIFVNSATSGIDSTEQSNKVLYFIKSLLQNIAPEVMLESAFVRKTAHFIEFFILGILYYTGSFFLKKSRVSLFIHSLSLSLFTAFIDETIQMFCVGRSPEVRDIWIDFLGAILAHVVLFAIYYSYKHFKKEL